MQVTRSLDSIHNELLTNHFNRRGKSAGTILWVFYSGVAMCAWCLYRVGQYIINQILPTTADSEWIEKHAKIRGFSKTSGETDSELLGRVIDDIQYPRAGGNKYDWPRWAKEVSYTHSPGTEFEWIESVNNAIVHENARGGGTVNLIITSDNPNSSPEQQATDDLIDAVEVYVEARRPLGLWDYQVIAADPLEVDVTIAITADDYASLISTIETQITNLLLSKLPGESLPISQIMSIAIECGADDVVVSEPAATVTTSYGPTDYERIFPGTITVNEI